MKKNQRLTEKKRPVMKAVKASIIILTLIYPIFMVMMTGAGLLVNRDSYGSNITSLALLLMLSGAFISAGAFLCLPRKSLCCMLSVIISVIGTVLCLWTTSKLISHADGYGWLGSGKYYDVPVSDMYRTRLLPAAIPAVLAAITSAVQFFSYELAEERIQRKNSKNVPSPSILGDDDKLPQ